MLLSLRSVSNLHSKRNKNSSVPTDFTPTAQPHAFAHLCLWAKQHPTVQRVLLPQLCVSLEPNLEATIFSCVLCRSSLWIISQEFCVDFVSLAQGHLAGTRLTVRPAGYRSLSLPATLPFVLVSFQNSAVKVSAFRKNILPSLTNDCRQGSRAQ